MIDWEKSAELNDMSVDALKLWFDKYPQSNKKVIRICNSCGEERKIYFYAYCDLCLECANIVSERCAAISEGLLNSDEVKAFAKKRRGVPRSPETCAKISKAKAGVPQPPFSSEHCTAISEGLLNSDVMKAQIESMRGGHDIVWHHWLYDHADLSKYTMPMTRSEHTSMHLRMRADGYKVKHINSENDDNGLWGYK